MYMVKDRQTAEDLVQEVYIKVLDSYKQFRGQSSEKTWIYAIARHVAIDWLRKQQRRQKKGIFQNNFDEGYMVKDDAPLPDEILTQNETVQQLYKYLDHCSIDQKTVLVMRYIQEMTITETAQALNWSESKVKTTQHRAIKHLRNIFQQHHDDWLKKGVNE
jgi:RNA polymerase sigma-70 factor, ECF subfamily